MWNKKKFEQIDFEIKKLWETRNADVARETNRIDEEKNANYIKCVNCVKCGMLGLKSKMKVENVMRNKYNRFTMTSSGSLIYPSYTITYSTQIPQVENEKENLEIVTEYTCIHCQKNGKKGKKKTA